MRQVLEQLAGIPGVVGALAAGPRGELLASAFPPLYDATALNHVAALLSDDTGGLRQLTGKDGSLDVRYARGRVLAKPFNQGTVLVLGTPSVDAGLLSLSMEQAARRLEEADAGIAPPLQPPAPIAAAPRAALPADVARARDPLQELLLRHIGPIGELVFTDAWTAWVGAAAPTRARLGTLVEDLAREVDDAAERKAFLAAAGKIVG